MTTYIDIAGIDVVGATESRSHYQPHSIHVHCREEECTHHISHTQLRRSLTRQDIGVSVLGNVESIVSIAVHGLVRSRKTV